MIWLVSIFWAMVFGVIIRHYYGKTIVDHLAYLRAAGIYEFGYGFLHLWISAYHAEDRTRDSIGEQFDLYDCGVLVGVVSLTATFSGLVALAIITIGWCL